MSRRDATIPGATTSALSPMRAHSPQVSAVRARKYGSFYFAEHVLRSMRSYGWTILGTSIGNPIVYLVAMGIGLATLVDANTGSANTGSAGTGAGGSAIGLGVSYLTFIAPALLATSAIMATSEEYSYPVMAGFKWRRVYYGPNASPLSSRQLVGGSILGVAVRLFFACGVYFLFLMLFGAVPQASGWLMIFTAVLTGYAFGLPLMAYAAGIVEDKGQFAMVQRFVVMPLFLFSGTFFPLDALPPAVRWIGWISPLWHGTELGRDVSYGYAEPGWLTVVHVLYLAVLAVGGGALAARRYERRLGK